MKKIEVYDPPMCCSSGVCGTDIDPKLVQFAADLSWLQKQGVEVKRFNLAQQPQAFTHPIICEALSSQGNDCLPIVLVNDKVATHAIYPTREQLAALAGVSVNNSTSGCCGGNKGSGKRKCC